MPDLSAARRIELSARNVPPQDSERVKAHLQTMLDDLSRRAAEFQADIDRAYPPCEKGPKRPCGCPEGDKP